MGMIVWRWIPHKNENITFPGIDPKYGDFAFLKPSKAQEIVFRDIEPKKPIYITPYALGGWEQFNELNDAGTSYEEESKPILKFGGFEKYWPQNWRSSDLVNGKRIIGLLPFRI